MNLGARYWRFSRKADAIAATFRFAAGPADLGCLDAHAFSREAAAILLQDQWNSFCRDLIIGSWRGGVTTMGGVNLPSRTGPTGEAVALTALRATYTGKQKKSGNWEPKWFDALAAIDAARRLAVPNFNSVVAGIGITPSPLDELRAVRNYFAHRGRETVTRLAPFVPAGVSDAAVHALITGTTLGGAMVLERWASELDTMARAAVA